jgi:hypothetical protein
MVDFPSIFQLLRRLMLQLQATQRRPSLSCRRFVNEMKEKDPGKDPEETMIHEI